MFNEFFWLLAVFPLVWALIAKFLIHEKFSWIEFGIQVSVSTFLIVILWVVGFNSDAWDREIWNGSISNKQMVQRDCPTGWRSSRDSFCEEYNTRSVYSHQSCSTVNKIQTCNNVYKDEYEAIYPWERKWYVQSVNLQQEYEIERVDSQGADTPPRYDEVRIGDPISITNGYDNWVKGAADSLFHEDGVLVEKYVDFIPEYPLSIYDYYKVDRVFGIGVDIPDIADWNADFSRILGKLGPERQMNGLLFIVNSDLITDDYPFAVRRAWNGFKKNDAAIFVGVNASNEIQWAEVLSWSKENAFNVELRNAILANRGQVLDRTALITSLDEIGMTKYVRRSMEEFEYLKDQITPPLWLVVLELILALGGSIGLTFFFWKNDIA